MSRILLVDDDQQMTSALATTLRVLGHEVLAALDATEGERYVREASPDILLTDLMLPGVSGLDIIANTARQPAHIYSCLVTGMADYRLLKQAMMAGAWSIMSKPFALPELLRVVNTAKLHASVVQRLGSDETVGGDLVLSSENSAGMEEAVSRLAHYAAAAGADQDTVTRRIPIVAAELISNVQRHGGGQWVVSGHSDGEHLCLRVEDRGGGFAWQRELSRRRTNWDSSKASGLQLVLAIADDFYYEGDGRFACVTVTKLSEVRKLTPAELLAAV